MLPYQELLNVAKRCENGSVTESELGIASDWMRYLRIGRGSEKASQEFRLICQTAELELLRASIGKGSMATAGRALRHVLSYC